MWLMINKIIFACLDAPHLEGVVHMNKESKEIKMNTGGRYKDSI